jgi:hypothetical protein
MEKEVVDAIGEALKKSFEERQKRPDQYVVAYKKKNEELIGYHADTFCNVTKNIFNGKRYAGSDPYSQLEVIWNNLKYAMSKETYVEKYMPGLTIDDVYIDAVYLAEGMEPQRFNLKIMNNG